MDALTSLLINKTEISEPAVANILALLRDGATIPFIARYRKEATGGVSEEQLRHFAEVYASGQKLLERKADVLRLIAERGHLDDALQRRIEKTQSMTELEDLYRPYKEKKSTRAGQALARGLQPLADVLQNASLSAEVFEKKAAEFVHPEVPSPDQAIHGAQDILAERFSDDPQERSILRDQIRRHGFLEIGKGKEFEPKGHYATYAQGREKIGSIPSHRYLAIMRGVREKQLRVKISMDTDRYLDQVFRHKIPRQGKSSDKYLRVAYSDGFKRLLFPAVEREIHAELKERSDRQAIAVFGKNLCQLLMTPPVSGQVLMGVDPAYRTGCKLAVIDAHGWLLDFAVIYPTAPQKDYQGARDTVLELVRKHGIQGVAIGNGTASRETQEFFATLNQETGCRLKYTVVSEAGASVYSASKLGQEEYPDLDVTVRGAISIAQRLRDPMAELIKIDPKSLGIGQYQHDVDQKLLEQKLNETIEDLVNQVGVEVNSASTALLVYVSGLGPKLARGIVQWRREHGSFQSKKDLLGVKGLGPKAFEQCAGFVRIRDGRDMLDNTGIHPESYAVAALLNKRYDPKCIGQEEIVRLSRECEVGMETLKDIVFELQKPGFDPREALPAIPFRDDVRDINALQEGDLVSGVVRSIVDFGAFVDIGLKNDGLIHISEISAQHIRHPLEVLSVNQYLPVIRVLAVDTDKGRVSLSLKKE
jgi:uncharacterized protein